MGTCWSCPSTGSVAVLERCGKHYKMADPGCHCVVPCFGEYKAGTISLRIQQLDVQVETKSYDNVFVYLLVSVQYRVNTDKKFEYFYRLSNTQQQLRAYVFDEVRSSVPKMSLDQVFEQKEDIAKSVKEELSKSMEGFGIEIVRSLVTDITPDSKVKDAMNQINAAQRERVAAQDKAEAEKVKEVKAAEADAESKYLAGTGIARQRQAIVNGLRESVAAFQDNVSIDSKEVLNLLITTQYFDTLREVGGNNRASTIFIPHSPNQVTDTTSQIRNAILQGQAAPSR